MRILLIEDYADAARALTLMLEREGFDVTWASTGLEALQLSKVEPFDLIISDIWLTDVDGLSLMHKLRSRCETPAIAFSGERLSPGELLGAGFVASASKTSDFDTLLGIIRQVLPSHPHPPTRRAAAVA